MLLFLLIKFSLRVADFLWKKFGRSGKSVYPAPVDGLIFYFFWNLQVSTQTQSRTKNEHTQSYGSFSHLHSIVFICFHMQINQMKAETV